MFLPAHASSLVMVLLQTDQAFGRAGSFSNEAKYYLTQAVSFLAERNPVRAKVAEISETGDRF
jgi:hypothetical protein